MLRSSCASRDSCEPLRIALTGTTGRVGAALAQALSAKHRVISLPRNCCDLAERGSLAAALKRLECDVFINPAAITSLEACEDDPLLAMRVNRDAPAEIAAWAADRGVMVFHFSTDYVFGGTAKYLYRETDMPEPISQYGRSKLAGENSVLAHPGNCVVRVSWVFGPEKPSFIDQILEAALAGRPLSAVADKFSLPLSTTDLADWMGQLVELRPNGILHACNSGDPVSWHGLATAAVEEAHACGLLAGIPPIQEQQLGEMISFRAARPVFTAMDTSRLAGLLGYVPRPWREAIAEHIRQCRALTKDYPRGNRKVIRN